MLSGETISRIMIRELIEAHCDSVIRFIPANWAAAWSFDATWKINGHTYEGRAEIVDAWLIAMNRIDAIAIFAFPGSIVVDGDRASAVTHTIEHISDKNGCIRMISGMYEDQLVQELNNTWKFKHRTFSSRILEMPRTIIDTAVSSPER